MHVEFPLLSDTDSAIISRFGILNVSVKKDSPTYGIPYPGIYVLDAKGVVRAKYFEDDFRQRDTAGMILLKQFGLMPETPHTSISGKHVRVSESATDANPHMGQHLCLILEVDLPPRTHAYAPGVKGYIPIDWKLPETQAFRVGPVTYPASKSMRLEAIKETVPVYTEKLRLVRDITLADEKSITPLLDSSGNLKLAGTLRYQACNDEECFIPETVPVDLTLHFAPLDLTRVSQSLQRK